MTAKQKELRLPDYIEHVIEASALACSYVEGMNIENFRADRKTQQAVILNLVVVGEAATQIMNEYPEFVTKHPEIPWWQIRGMRNRMAHGYFEIDLNIVWDTVRISLPALREQLERASSPNART